MKKSKLKSPKRKVIPHRYQKNSNTSLSKLLHIASYKKRINDLVYNNRRLARELQSAKCEIAAQNNLLEENAKNKNQVMFAILKLKDATCNLDEAMNYLRNSLSSNEIKFPSKGFSHPKKVVPTVDCIEEVSVLSSDSSFKENTPQPGISSPNSPRHLASGKRKSSPVKLLNNSQSDDSESCEVSASLPPILFVEDSEDAQEKNVKNSSKTKSSEHGKGDNRSLTPELDIDFPYFIRKKSNSRRKTSNQFKLSNPRNDKSLNKLSPEDSLPLLLPEQNDEHRLLSMAPSSSNCRTKVSNSRKSKSRGKTSEVTSPLLESEQNVHCSVSSVVSNSSCQTVFNVSDIKKSKSRGKSSPEVVSPPLQCEEIFVQTSCSRRQSLIKISNPRKTKSRGKSSPEADLLLLQSEQMSLEASNCKRKSRIKSSNSRKARSRGKSPEAASPMLKCTRMSIKTAEKQQDEVSNSPKISKHENENYLSNLHCIAETLPNHSSDFLISDMPSDCTTFKMLPDVPSNTEPLSAIPNNTLLLCEDMELTDVIAVNPIILQYNTVNSNYEIKSNVPEISNCSKENSNSEKEPSKLNEVPEPFVENNNDLPNGIKDNIQENVMEQNKISELTESNTLPPDDSLLIALPKIKRTSHVHYCYFSSSGPSDSEDEYVPSTSKSRKKRSSSEKRETVIFKPDTISKISTELNSSGPVGNVAVHEPSIFSFNASYSEKDDISQDSKNKPKKSKLSRNKKIVKKNDLPMKPLSQSCNVTKLKGFNYKFSKTKSPIGGRKLSKGNKQKKSDLSSDIFTSVLSDGSVSNGQISQLLTNISQDTSSNLQVKDMTKSVQNACKGVLKDLSISEGTPKKQDSTFENAQYERKKVSFAPTDLVCKFKKMSLSKTIAANTKVRRISKSVADLVDLCEEDIAVQPPSFDKLNDPEDSLFDFDGETELYTINLQSNPPFSTSEETDQQSLPKSAISSVVEHDKEILCNKNLTNNNKTEKISKTRIEASQKKLLQTASPLKSIPKFKDMSKNDATKKSSSLNKAKASKQPLCSDKINDTKDSLFDFSDITELYSTNFPSDNLCSAPQAIDQLPPLKINIPSIVEPNKEILGTHTENLTNENEKILKTEVAASQKKLLQKVSPAKKISAFKSLSVKTSKKSVKLYSDSKENCIQNHLETVRTSKQIKQRGPLSPIQPLQDDLKVRCIDTGASKLTSSAKSKKRVTKKITKSAPPVLEDPPKSSIDIKDDAETDDRPKRRSKPVTYTEPSLNKKLRRA